MWALELLYHNETLRYWDTKEELDKIYTLAVSGMSTNKAKRVEANGYGAITTKDEATNNVHIGWFTSIPNTLQE